jgi:hypothetical protein
MKHLHGWSIPRRVCTWAAILISVFVQPVLAGSTDPPVHSATDLRGRGCLPSVDRSTSKLTGDYLGQQPPGTTAELFAPGVVSTCKEHSAAMFTPDGKELYFGRMFPPEIFVMRQVDEVWTGPEVVSFSGRHGDLYPFLSSDGELLVFSSSRPIEPGADPVRGQAHLWMAHRTTSGWSEPAWIDLGSTVRPSGPSIDGDGNLYFNQRVESASADLFEARREGDGYGTPRNLGRVINSDQPDHSPFIAADGSYFVFSSFHRSRGRSDLFVSFRAEDGSWTRPRNLGARVNSEWKDEAPYVSADGRYLFFNSNRPSILHGRPVPDGPGNMYWVDASVIEQLRP